MTCSQSDPTSSRSAAPDISGSSQSSFAFDAGTDSGASNSSKKSRGSSTRGKTEHAYYLYDTSMGMRHNYYLGDVGWDRVI
jgi:hypothetical protein